MKLYISADIEGCTGITAWDETDASDPKSEYFRKQMTREVAAVCRAAGELGYETVSVRDAHDTGRNIIPNLLPDNARLFRGFSGDPFQMLSGMEPDCTAAVFVGYHSGAYTGASPLAHTMATHLLSVEINGSPASEFLINAYTAAYIGVPVVMLTGDYALCYDAERHLPGLYTVPTQVCKGGSTLSYHPDRVVDRIEKTAKEALSPDGLKNYKPIALPEHFELKVTYKDHKDAYKNSFWPGARLYDPSSVFYESDSWYDILRYILFCM